MRHARDPMKCEERRANGARHEGSGQSRRAKDTTSVSRGTAANTPPGRKSASVLSFAVYLRRIARRLSAELLEENDQDAGARAWGERRAS